MGRLNRSIEALVYCVLGSQVKTRSTIVGASGSAVETRQMFRQLLEETIVVNDISTGIQNYQRALSDARAQLNLAVAPGLWLLPSRVIINTDSVLGYNNELQKATSDMIFGVNPRVNKRTQHRTPKIKAPLPLVPKTIPKTKAPVPLVSETMLKIEPPVPLVPKTKAPVAPSAHERNLAAVTVVAAGATWWLFR